MATNRDIPDRDRPDAARSDGRDPADAARHAADRPTDPTANPSKALTPGARPPLALGVLLSGAGSNLQNLIDRIADRRLRHVRIAAVLSSRSNVRGVDRAREAGLPVEIVRVKDYADAEAFSAAVVAALEKHGVDLAVMAGWLCYWKIPPRWLGRVINLHPSILPAYGGQGYYGRRVHEAVLAAREPVSGATVHWVDNQYDHGEILLQGRCRVAPDDTPDTLASRVGLLEKHLLPAAIDLIRDQWRKSPPPAF